MVLRGTVHQGQSQQLSLVNKASSPTHFIPLPVFEDCSISDSHLIPTSEAQVRAGCAVMHCLGGGNRQLEVCSSLLWLYMESRS